MNTLFCFWLVFFLFSTSFSQTYPTWGPEIPVTVNGLTQDAMEPHISPDGNALFFNDINDGITTELYYSAKVNDSTFNFLGLVPVVNQTVTPRLDAVASLDTANNFYWVSTRDYPAEMDNLFRIRFLTSGYENFGRLHGNFYIYQPGWILMDAAVSYGGQELYYCNAFFDTCGIPCKAKLGIAEKVNDSTFNKIPQSDAWLANINQDTINYIIYAPCISNDGLELYFTRAPLGGLQTEICVSVRTDTNSAFSVPQIIEATPFQVPEAPTLTLDKSIIYYHKKISGTYQLFMRYRTSFAESIDVETEDQLIVYPNPATDELYIRINFDGGEIVKIYSLDGQLIQSSVIEPNTSEMYFQTEEWSPGIYILQYNKITEKIIIE